MQSRLSHWQKKQYEASRDFDGLMYSAKLNCRTLAPIALLLAWPMSAAAHEPSEAAKQRMLDGGLFDYIWIGAEHMLTGYDHLLFLVGVLLFLTKTTDIVKFVTAFTIGHTVTLLGGTLAEFRINHYFIDAIIALTVIYKAFENLGGFQRFLKFNPPPILMMVFVFGLIHGMGLSTRLQDLSISAEPGLVVRILAFNVGVELGQLTGLFVMALAIAVWRGTPGWPQIAKATNLGLIACGLWMFAAQVNAAFGEPASVSLAKSSHPTMSSAL